jgi:hypothetical protein
VEILKDGNGHSYIEWSQTQNAWKRAWVQHRSGDNDWADTGRYLNVVRCSEPGRPGGNATDFPICSKLSDDQILLAFVHSVNAITGLVQRDD